MCGPRFPKVSQTRAGQVGQAVQTGQDGREDSTCSTHLSGGLKKGEKSMHETPGSTTSTSVQLHSAAPFGSDADEA
eukprot:11503308-Karenia_brevis.AAC.1